MQTNKTIIYGILLLVSSFIFSCSKDDDVDYVVIKENKLMDIPQGFPEMKFSEGNEFNKERWDLGKKLFYDPIMSLNNTVSCASCHKVENAFSDTVAFSLGNASSVGKSNAPTLTNIGYNPYFTRAGGVPTLEMQILVPIQEHDEFNTNILDIVEKLKLNEYYSQQSLKAYNREIDSFVITRALANFERSLISGNSQYDKFVYQNNSTAFTSSQQKGKDLFFSSKTNCYQCHSDFNFTNYAFENNGIYVDYADLGRMRLTNIQSDKAKFKVPTLRNIALTAPYMHDGSITTLEGVVNHYDSGGKPHMNKNSLIRPLGLTSIEKSNLVDFLNSLTDNDFINNNNFKK